ncbi:MAG: hypothetical protein ACKVS9_06390 [Phycisphaerae bacterium]
MRSAAYDHHRPTTLWVAPFVLVVLALVCSALGVWSLSGVWQRLPQSRLKQNLAAQLADAQRALPSAETLRRGMMIREAGRVLKNYLPPRAAAGDPQGDVLRIYAGASPGEISRMHLAAARMLTLEKTNQPRETWWASLRPFFEGTAASPMPTFERDFLVTVADAYDAKTPLDVGTAYEMSEQTIQHTQSGVVQYLGQRVRQIVDERRAIGDGQGATIARLAFVQFMRSLLAPNEPAMTRLLAADVLADFLAREPKDIRPREVIAALRAWRGEITKAAHARASTMFGLSGGPDLVSPLQQHLANSIGRSASLAVVCLLLGTITLLLAWPLLAGGISAIRYRGVAYAGVGLALAVIVAVMVLQGAMTERVFEDIRRAHHESWTTLVTPRVVGALTLALALLAVLIPLGGAHHVGKLGRAGAICGIAWLCTSLWLLGSSIMAERARQSYEIELGRALRGDRIALLAGSDVEKKLDPVRAWQP